MMLTKEEKILCALHGIKSVLNDLGLEDIKNELRLKDASVETIDCINVLQEFIVDYVNSKQPYKFEELNDLMAYHDNKLNADCLIGQVYNKYSILIGWYDDEGHNEEWVKFEENRFYPVEKKMEEFING